jgi:aminoglycoside phosphotransferase (APT) family kinase protein
MTYGMHDELQQLIRGHYPGAQLLNVERLGFDDPTERTRKVQGYGRPLKLLARTREGVDVELVFRTATPDGFGHDRRSDRASEMLLDFDTFSTIPRHARALDVGVIDKAGGLVPLKDAGEFFVLTTYAPGRPYVEDLRTLGERRECNALDLERARALAAYLADLHREPLDEPVAYARALRDLVGSGEGIFGIVDGYSAQTPGASESRLRRIEAECCRWRSQLKGMTHRLRRTHGDFHPFNVLFTEGAEFNLVDTSRGSRGDPADDLAAMAINYPFFALQYPGTWTHTFQPLWSSFWASYQAERGDHELLNVIAPFLAWRALVVCSPRFYPAFSGAHRDALLSWIEGVLASRSFDPNTVEVLFR